MKMLSDLEPELARHMEEVLEKERDYDRWKNNQHCSDFYEKRKRKALSVLVEYLEVKGLGKNQSKPLPR